MWRAVSICLSTFSNLKKKHVPVEDVCSFCSSARETTSHCLVECNFAKSCLSQVLPGVSQDGWLNFANWFEDVCSKYGEKIVSRISVVCWAIWRARNDIVWNQKKSGAIWVVGSAITYLDSCKSAQEDEEIHRTADNK